MLEASRSGHTRIPLLSHGLDNGLASRYPPCAIIRLQLSLFMDEPANRMNHMQHNNGRPIYMRRERRQVIAIRTIAIFQQS